MAKNDAPTTPADIHVGAYFPPPVVDRLDAWAKAQLDGEGISRSRAFRMLLTQALDTAWAPGSAGPAKVARCAGKAKGLGRCILPAGHRAKHCNSKALDW